MDVKIDKKTNIHLGKPKMRVDNVNFAQMPDRILQLILAWYGRLSILIAAHALVINWYLTLKQLNNIFQNTILLSNIAPYNS